MTDSIKNVQANAVTFCQSQGHPKPHYVIESDAGDASSIHYKRKHAWTLEELFTSSVLLLFAGMVAALAFLITFSYSRQLAAAWLASGMAFVPVFYLIFIWFFARVEIRLYPHEMIKTIHFGLFKRESVLPYSSIVSFASEGIQTMEGQWKVSSRRDLNAYIIHRLARYIADMKNTKYL
ncbi:MAG: hypothetical protein MUF42_15755 [Cytophagaceae bacterium]|jgi:hypothetical protein|nr:hypothetical protein [Cytophagaceae bacterium]